MINSEKKSTEHSDILIKPLLIYGFVIIALLGFLDAVWLTTKYYIGTIDCSIIAGCQDVLSSNYSDIVGIPVALLGIIYYLFILLNSLTYIKHRSKFSVFILSFLPSVGFLFSIWLVYLQLAVINAICIYCMGSALSSTLLFIFSLIVLKNYYKLKNHKVEKVN